MTETNANIHVLADETLGGIKREYVEVDREVENGDTVLVTKMDGKDVCQIDKVIDIDFDGDQSYETLQLDRAINGEDLVNMLFDSEDVIVLLEPTDIVHIDDGRYEMMEREGEVGEKIIIVNADVQCEEPYNNGDIFEVESLLGCGRGIQTTCHRDIFDSEYRVLVPVEAAEDEPKPADPIDVISNLAQEVAELKRTVSRITDNLGWHEMGPGRIANLRNDVSDIKRDIASLEEQVDQDCAENEETYDHLYEEMKRMKDEIDTLHKDNRTLGEELARLKKPAENESVIESAPFVLIIHEGQGEFDVYQRGKKIENISRLEIEADSRLSSSIDLQFDDVGVRP